MKRNQKGYLMRKPFFIFIAGLLALAACAPVQPPTAGPNVETIVAATLAALTAGAPPPQPIATSEPPLPPSAQPDGKAVSYGNVSFFLPAGVATNALAGTVPAIPFQDGPVMDAAPEHIKFQLEGYALYNDTFHEPYLLVIPAAEYAALNPAGANSIARLQALINGTAAPAPENLPHVAFFNAAQAFAAQIQMVSFQNGRGVRFLTEYAQYYVTANNRDLFYEFQGLTSDGKYYILAILPASHPLLAPDEDYAAFVPAGGVPFPGMENQTALDAYYPAVENLLNVTSADRFTPTLANLDALVQSILVAP
jgi:hypothetical protein